MTSLTNGNTSDDNNKETTVVIEDDFVGYSRDSFVVPSHYVEYIDHVLIPQGAVRDRTQRMAQEIMVKLGNDKLIALCVLKGAYRFFNELLEEMKPFQKKPISMEFMRLKSYRNNASTGDVKVIFGEEIVESWNDKHLLIVEDIIDTGRTMDALLKLINGSENRPKSVHVASLLVKRRADIGVAYRPDYIGFEVPDRFVVGCAFDYNEYFRDLNHVCVLNDAGVEMFRE